ncbi:MAG TPA: SpoIIE family protein phosphatase [Ignavibacteriaceae bacterium]|nr:SpoIIE family protein phosphatase [Ignavibacteriaceae bacterium]
MDQRKLHKTIETIASQKFATEEEMLITVLNEIVSDKTMDITGGRVWKLKPEVAGYRLLYQTGKVDKIAQDFIIKLNDYPVFEKLSAARTILGHETNEELRKKGIFKYSASGVGYKIKIKDRPYYEYVLALNSSHIDEELRLKLNIIATALTSQIKQRRLSLSASNLKADIDKARELQKSILPEHEYKFHHFDIYGITVPADIVGGDFFDYLEIGDDRERIGVALGDAASKGVAAAAEAMYISGALRMASNFEIKISPLMKRMNRLVNKIFEDDKFSSLFYGELSTDRNGLFLYANAGHNPPIFYRALNNKVEMLQPTGPVLGPSPEASYFIESINIRLNDILVIYSDGVVESSNNKEVFYEEHRLVNLIKKVKDKTPKEIVYAILDDVIKFSKGGVYQDDKTLVVIKRTS